MNLFWTCNNIPEFKNLSKEERKSAWRSISAELHKNPKVRLATVIGMGAMIFLLIIGFTSAHAVLGWNRILTASCFGGLGGALNSVIVMSSVQKRMQPYINSYFGRSQ